MYREKLIIEDVGLKLDDNGKIAFCRYDDGFAASNLIIEFEWFYAGKEVDGRDSFDLTLISSAWYIAQKDVQHFTGTVNGKPEENPLHIAACVYARVHHMDEMIEAAQRAYDSRQDDDKDAHKLLREAA
jgi:hypothetical protein